MIYKLFKYGLFGLLLISLFGYGKLKLDQWHYVPIKTLANEKVKLETKIKALEYQIALLGTALNTCENNLSVQQLEGYIDCIDEEEPNELFEANSTFKYHT